MWHLSFLCSPLLYALCGVSCPVSFSSRRLQRTSWGGLGSSPSSRCAPPVNHRSGFNGSALVVSAFRWNSFCGVFWLSCGVRFGRQFFLETRTLVFLAQIFQQFSCVPTLIILVVIFLILLIFQSQYSRLFESLRNWISPITVDAKILHTPAPPVFRPTNRVSHRSAKADTLDSHYS